jgi:antitoxin (DNA-binding transcriptional repressor) of toxin-antitoxin stability system
VDVTRHLLDEVTATHPPLVITQRGRPAARVVPIDDGTAQCLFGLHERP